MVMIIVVVVETLVTQERSVSIFVEVEGDAGGTLGDDERLFTGRLPCSTCFLGAFGRCQEPRLLLL